MSERKSYFSKKDALKSLRINLVKAEFSFDRASRSAFETLADKNESLARDMGATEFEIADMYFSTKPKEARQNLLSAYCGKLWYGNKNFESLEELVGWVKDMQKIRDKYKLDDPLKPKKK